MGQHPRGDQGRVADGFARRRLLGVLSGGVLAQSCYAVSKLGVPDLLAAGPMPAAELAARTGANPSALRRILRALSSMGLFRRIEPDSYALTATSELLRSDIAGSLRQTAVLHGEEVHRSFAEIMHTVHTGQPAFTKVHSMPFYDYLAEHPEVADTFAEAMGSERVPAVLSACDLSGAGTVVDVGGGSGGLLAELLTTYRELRGVLLVLPDEPYEFTAADGPDAFPGVPYALVNGRQLTWCGPSLVAARSDLAAAIFTPGGLD